MIPAPAHKGCVLLVDGLNLFVRNWAANPTMDPNGEPIGGIIGSMRSVKSMVDSLSPSAVVVAWDGEGGSLKRRSAYKDYKAGRKPRANREYDHDTPREGLDNLKAQYGRLKGYFALMGFVQVDVPGIEADDVIAFVCSSLFPGTKKLVVSTDRDMLQLVSDTVVVWSPTKKRLYETKDVVEDTGVLPENVPYMKAVCGDGSDNIPGIAGIGPRTFAKMFPAAAGRGISLDDVLAAPGDDAPRLLKKHRPALEAAEEQIRRNVGLVQLRTPIISAQSVRMVRHACSLLPEYRATDLKLSLLRDGIVLTEVDMFAALRAQAGRTAAFYREHQEERSAQDGEEGDVR